MKEPKPLRLQRDVKIKCSACTNCGRELDGATAVTESVDSRPRKHMPKPGDFTVCITCGHLMAFADDLTLRDPTPEEQIQVAGDRRVLTIQQARGAVMREKGKDFFNAKGAETVPGGSPPGDPGDGGAEGLSLGVSGADRIRQDPGGGDDR